MTTIQTATADPKGRTPKPITSSKNTVTTMMKTVLAVSRQNSWSVSAVR